MLQKLNERIQGVVAWVIIGLVAITFTLFGIDYYMQSRQDTSVEVVVNGQPLTKQAFELNYRRARQAREASELTSVGEKQIKTHVLDEMIANQISLQSAISNGFYVSANQVNNTIVSIPQFQQDGQFSAEKYGQALSSAMFTPQSFQQEVQQGMLQNQQRFAFIGTAFSLPLEISQFVALYMQTRDFSYLQIPAVNFLQSIHIADDDIAHYYAAHTKQFFSDERVSINYVRLSMQDIKKKINITESMVKRYYDENQTQPEMAKPFAKVRDVIRAQLLAERAQTLYASALEKLTDVSFQSPDTLLTTASSLDLPIEKSSLFSIAGGDTALLKDKRVVNAAFSRDVLEKGNNSEPIQLDNDSVIVLRVHQRLPVALRTLNEVRPLIVGILTREKATSRAAAFGAMLLQTPQPANTKELLVANNLQWHTVKNAARDDEQNPAALGEIAFNVARVGEKAGQTLANGDFIIVQLNNIHTGELDSLDKERIASIRQQIEASYGLMDYDLYFNGLMSRAKIARG